MTARSKVLMLLDNDCNPDMRVLREASTLDSVGWEVEIWCWDRTCVTPVVEKKGGVLIRRFRTPAGRQLGVKQIIYLFQFYLKVVKEILKRRNKFRVIHAHDLNVLPLAVLLKKVFRVAPGLVYDAHEIYHLMEARRYSPRILKMIRSAEIRLLEGVDVFINPSHYRWEEYWRDLVSCPSFVVGNWYDAVDRSADERESMRRKLGIDQAAYVIGYAGSLHPTRKVMDLCRLAEQRRDIVAVIAGDGALAEEIKAAAERTKNVKYLGWVSDPDQFYGLFDAIYYVYDSEHPYSRFVSPNALFLGIANKLPLVASRSGEVGFVLSRLNCPLLESSDHNGLSELVNRVMKWTRSLTGQEWRDVQTEFSWTKARENLVNAYSVIP